MPRGKSLTGYERGRIDQLAADGTSEREIASALGRSKTVVHNYLHNPEVYGTAKRPGRPPKLSQTTKRRLLRAAHTGKFSSKQLADNLDLHISSSRVRQLLADCPTLKFKKRKRTPKLTPAHKRARLEWARKCQTWRAKWRKIVWSDEKKFSLDGPDGFQYYWHDLRRDEEIYSTRQNGGGSVMIWAAFSSGGKSTLAFLRGRQNSEAYTHTLEQHLLPFTTATHAAGCIYQQDNASIHVSRHSTAWLREHNITTLDWPAKSPDLNPIENVWGILARRVYAGGRQFSTPEELISTIKVEWEKIDQSELDQLVKSMPKRVGQVLEMQGSKSKY